MIYLPRHLPKPAIIIGLVLSGLLFLGGLAVMFEWGPPTLPDLLSRFLLETQICETDCRLGNLLNPDQAQGLLVLMAGLILGMAIAFRRALKGFVTRQHLNILRGIVAIMSGVFLPRLAYYKYFSKDTLEHVHSAWMMNIGYLPYVDFFQNHHPLLWIFLMPILHSLPESGQVLIYLRFLQAAGILALLWLTFRLVKELSLSAMNAWLTLALLATIPSFFLTAIDIRPDLWQVIMQMLSILYFIRFLDSRRKFDLGLSGLWAGVAFLFLQKAIFYFLHTDSS